MSRFSRKIPFISGESVLSACIPVNNLLAPKELRTEYKRDFLLKIFIFIKTFLILQSLLALLAT